MRHRERGPVELRAAAAQHPLALPRERRGHTVPRRSGDQKTSQVFRGTTTFWHCLMRRRSLHSVPSPNLGKNYEILRIRLSNLQIAKFHESYRDLKKISYPNFFAR